MQQPKKLPKRNTLLGKSPSLMGISSTSVVIFHSYVELPEGKPKDFFRHQQHNTAFDTIFHDIFKLIIQPLLNNPGLNALRCERSAAAAQAGGPRRGRLAGLPLGRGAGG